MIMCKCGQVGNNLFAVLLCGLGCSNFHFSTLEEYYTGGLYLGPFNGVTDGSVALITLYIAMGIIGNNNFWVIKIASSDIRVIDIFGAILIV